MTEATIRGLIQGSAFAFIGLIAWLIWKLVKSPSEGARRVKLVIAVMFGLLILVVVSNEGREPLGAIMLVAIVGIGYWIYRGFKKKA